MVGGLPLSYYPFSPSRTLPLYFFPWRGPKLLTSSCLTSRRFPAPVMTKGPESTEQSRLDSLGIQRDREVSMRAHMLLKKPESNTIQLTAEEHKRRAYMSKHSSATVRNQQFHTICHWISTETSSHNHRFLRPFGYLLDPWTPSGRDLAAKWKPSEFWTTFLFDFWWIWEALGHPFGLLSAEKLQTMTSRTHL